MEATFTLNQLLVDVLPELIATIIGVLVGGTLAFTTERVRSRRERRQRARIILHSLTQELEQNYRVMQKVLPQFQETTYGKSYFLQTVAWETALASEQLPNIIGFQLADTISAQYGHLLKLRYYGDLMVQVWLTTPSIDGYSEIQRGFREIIDQTMNEAIANHPRVMQEIGAGRNALRFTAPQQGARSAP